MLVHKIRHLFFASLALVLFGSILLLHAPLTANAQKNSDIIPGKFIVVLKDNTGDPQGVANEMAKTHGFPVEHVYGNVL